MSTQARQIADRLLARDPLPPLKPGKLIYSQELKFQIASLNDPPLVKAALHLANDDVESCHDIAQDHNSPNGMLLHAVLHRREGDHWNSIYWLNRVKHPLIAKRSDAIEFVNACERVSGKKGDPALEQRQMDELCKIVNFVLDHER